MILYNKKENFSVIISKYLHLKSQYQVLYLYLFNAFLTSNRLSADLDEILIAPGCLIFLKLLGGPIIYKSEIKREM
jgi:hypothetical protein